MSENFTIGSNNSRFCVLRDFALRQATAPYTLSILLARSDKRYLISIIDSHACFWEVGLRTEC